MIEDRVAESRSQYRLISSHAHGQMITLPLLACLLAEALAAKPVVAEPLTTARRAFCGSIVATKRSRPLFSPIVRKSLPRAVASKPLAPDMSRITSGLSRASTSASGGPVISVTPRAVSTSGGVGTVPHGIEVASSCKGRGVCPSRNGRHMSQTAAHLVGHVIPPVPVRQWMISVPRRLQGRLADRPAAVAALTKIFLDEIERLLCHDDRDVFQASPDELPAIDIHSL